MTTEPNRWHEPTVTLPTRTAPSPRPAAGCPECARPGRLRKAAAVEQTTEAIGATETSARWGREAASLGRQADQEVQA